MTRDQLRRHRMGADFISARHADDAGPRAVLRRPGPQQERAGHDHAELHHARPDQRSSSCSSATAWPSARTTVGLIGNFSTGSASKDVSPIGAEPAYAATIPHQTYMIFQLMFAVITPALITGAFAERAKFSTFLVFMLLWATLVYDPVAHWVWGAGGWLGLIPGGQRRRWHQGARLRRRHRRPHQRRCRGPGRGRSSTASATASAASRWSRTTSRWS